MTEDEEMQLLATLTNRIRSAISSVPLSQAWRLRPLRDGVVTMRDTLEKILDDDTIGQNLIDDGGFVMDQQIPTNEDERTNEDWRAMRGRNQEHRIVISAAKQISRLSAGRNEDEAFSFLLSLNNNWTSATPAERSFLCREYFGDPETLHFDLGSRLGSLTNEWRLSGYDKWIRDRLRADRQIIELVDSMRREIVNLRAANVGPSQMTAATIEAEAFEEVSKLCGKPIKLIAKVYAALDWADTSVEGGIEVNGVTVMEKAIGPRARRENLIHANLTPEPELPLSATTRQSRRGRQVELTEHEMALMQAQSDARKVMTKAIYQSFLNLRAELNRYHTQQRKRIAA